MTGPPLPPHNSHFSLPQAPAEHSIVTTEPSQLLPCATAVRASLRSGPELPASPAVTLCPWQGVVETVRAQHSTALPPAVLRPTLPLLPFASQLLQTSW